MLRDPHPTLFNEILALVRRAACRLRRGAARHASDCAVHNRPAFDAGLCDCGDPEPLSDDDKAFLDRRGFIQFPDPYPIVVPQSLLDDAKSLGFDLGPNVVAVKPMPLVDISYREQVVQHGGQRPAAKALGISLGKLQRELRKERAAAP